MLLSEQPTDSFGASFRRLSGNGSRFFSFLDRRERGLNCTSLLSELFGELKPGSEFFERFVDRKSGRGGGDFKENSSGRRIVNRLEIVAISHAGNSETGFAQQFLHPQLRSIIGNIPGDMMNGPRAAPSGGDRRLDNEIDQIPGTSIASFQSDPALFAANFPKSHYLCQQLLGRLGISQRQFR